MDGCVALKAKYGTAGAAKSFSIHFPLMEKAVFDRMLSAWFARQFASVPEVPLGVALAGHRGVTVQAANHQLRRLVDVGVLKARLVGRRKLYRLAVLRKVAKSFDRTAIQEDAIWRNLIAPCLDGFCEPPAMRVLEYGSTEMLNNARDHSEGRRVAVSVEVSMAFATIRISDDGEGIFARIRRLCGLGDERESLLELAKGKLTTDPERHTGEGVFFTSRAIDRFVILSGDLSFSHEKGGRDFLLGHDDVHRGTTVVMRHAHTSPTKLKAVFDEFAAPEEYTFSKTIVPLRLAIHGNENLMSRSQARRVLAGIERFRTVMLDFEGVEFVGQAFADEVFRVFANQHPEIEIIPIHTNAAVGQMVARAAAGRIRDVEG